MKSYLTQTRCIKVSELSQKDFCKNSLCPKDYKNISLPKISKPLKDFLSSVNKGKEIGSSLYMKKSKYRFLKTVNITERCLYEQSNVEFCAKVSNFSPLTGNIFIVKDGAGDGLGQVAYYIKNDLFVDFISAGIISVDLKEEHKWYVLAFLKSKHFRDYINVNTAQGSTIRHSKMVALDYQVPFPVKDGNNTEKYLSDLMCNLLDKEKEINIRRIKIDEIIENELNIQESEFKIHRTTKNDLLSHLRMDTGLYSLKYTKINDAIEHYNQGYYSISLDKIKSGSTPKIRIFNGKNSKFLWVTPTNIQDEGFYNPIERISMPTENNIKQDCVLFINRTSKGSKGEFVGITCFYDHSYYGDGHHNQGIYRISDLPRNEQFFIVAFMNSRIMRRLCGCISLGSKMKEMKSKDFSKIKFPKFPNEIKDEISKLYFLTKNEQKTTLNLDSYLSVEMERNKVIGIFQLNKEILELKKKIDNAVHAIIHGDDIAFDFSYRNTL